MSRCTRLNQILCYYTFLLESDHGIYCVYMYSRIMDSKYMYIWKCCWNFIRGKITSDFWNQYNSYTLITKYHILQAPEPVPFISTIMCFYMFQKVEEHYSACCTFKFFFFQFYLYLNSKVGLGTSLRI